MHHVRGIFVFLCLQLITTHGDYSVEIKAEVGGQEFGEVLTLDGNCGSRDLPMDEFASELAMVFERELTSALQKLRHQGTTSSDITTAAIVTEPMSTIGTSSTTAAILPSTPKTTTDVSSITDMSSTESMFSAITSATTHSSTTASETTTAEERCDFMYNGTCYWLEVRIQTITFTEANEICAEQSTEPASFVDESHFNLTVEHIRSKAFLSRMIIWTGIRYDPMTNSTENGIADNLKWYPGWPRNDSTNTYVGLHVSKDAGTKNQGLLNIRPSYTTHVVLCQTPIPKELCQVKYKETCSWFDIHFEKDVTFVKAEEICGEYFSEPASIHDKAQYSLAMEHIRRNIPFKRSGVTLWTGIRYDPTTNTFGTNLWWPSGDAVNNDTYTHAALFVAADPSSSGQGMFNASPLNVMYGVLCQQKLRSV